MKVNIGTLKTHKLEITGDYWDEETVSHIVDLLTEY